MKGTRQWNELREQITAEQGGLCWYCGTEVSAARLAPLEVRAVIDHKEPRRRGGGNERENLVVACVMCNSRKGVRDVEGFRDYLVGLSPYARAGRAMDEFSAETGSLPEHGARFRAWLAARTPSISFHGERV